MNILEQYGGRTWKSVQKELAVNHHLLVFQDPTDDLAVEVAKAFDEHGTEAGMGTLVAALFTKKHGAVRAANMGSQIYEDIYRKRGKMPHHVAEMVYWVAWMSSGPVKDLKWPLEPPKAWDEGEWAGTANVLLLLALRGLEGSNTEVLAGRAIGEFLKAGMEKRKKESLACV